MKLGGVPHISRRCLHLNRVIGKAPLSRRLETNALAGDFPPHRQSDSKSTQQLLVRSLDEGWEFSGVADRVRLSSEASQSYEPFLACHETGDSVQPRYIAIEASYRKTKKQLGRPFAHPLKSTD
jgi:hypothetical protein